MSEWTKSRFSPHLYRLLFAMLAVCVSMAGCGKLPKPEEILKSGDATETAPPEAVAPAKVVPTPAEIVAGFVALPQHQKTDEALQQVAEQTEELQNLSELELATSAVTDIGTAFLPRFAQTTRLNLTGTRVTGQTLEYAAAMPSLKALGFSGIPLEDHDLQRLSASSRLEELSLARTSIGDGAFEPLAALTSLRVLDVSGNDQLLGRSFSEMVREGRFANLETLTVDSTGFGYYGLQELGRLKKLQFLSANRSSVGDESLEGLRANTSLRQLYLSDNQITDAGLASLKRLTQLEELRLNGNLAISDRGLIELRGLKQLRELRLDGTRCTLAAVQELKAKHLKSTTIRFADQEF